MYKLCLFFSGILKFSFIGNLSIFHWKSTINCKFKCYFLWIFQIVFSSFLVLDFICNLSVCSIETLGLEEILIIYFRHSQTDLPQKKETIRVIFLNNSCRKKCPQTHTDESKIRLRIPLWLYDDQGASIRNDLLFSIYKRICGFVNAFVVFLFFAKTAPSPACSLPGVSIEAKFIGVAGSFWQTVAKQGLAFQTNKQPVEPAGLNSITQLSSQFSSVRFGCVLLCSVLFCFLYDDVTLSFTDVYCLGMALYSFGFCVIVSPLRLFFGGWVWNAGWMDAASQKLYTQHNSDWGGIAPIFGVQMIKSTSLWWVASSAL